MAWNRLADQLFTLELKMMQLILTRLVISLIKFNFCIERAMNFRIILSQRQTQF